MMQVLLAISRKWHKMYFNIIMMEFLLFQMSFMKLK